MQEYSIELYLICTIFYVGNLMNEHLHSHDNHQHHHSDHEHTILGELTCHLPYAIFAVAMSLSLASFLSFFSCGVGDFTVIKKGSKLLFHSFHFMHIAFAATGTLITFFRFSSNKMKALLVGSVAPIIFCTLSDAILPYLGGIALGIDMKFHLCFATELRNILPFLFIGVLNGFVMSAHHKARQSAYSLFSHATHIMISSLAAIFYLVSHGFLTWYTQIGYVFLFLVWSVVIPCTISDVVIPMIIAKNGKV